MTLSNKLRQVQIDRVGPPAKAGGSGSKLTDGGGLYLLVSPAGSKGWRLKYFLHGKECLISLGLYPAVSLTMARERREDIRRLVAQGIDPQAERVAARTAHTTTFLKVAEQYLENRKGTSARLTQEKQTWLLGLLKKLHKRPVGAVTTPDVVGVLEKIESNGRHETAHRACIFIGQVYRFGKQKGLTTAANPAADVRGALKPVVVAHHAGLKDPTKVGGLLRAIDGYVGEPIVRLALRLAPLVFVRPGELRGARWDEIDFKTATWTIPRARMKMKLEHIVPLSRQALAIFTELQAVAWLDTFVFPGVLGSDRPMSDNTLTAALRRMGYRGDEQTVHGFRSTASTLLNEHGWGGPKGELVELQLAHADPNKVRSAYNSAEKLPDRRAMMQKWADYLDDIKNPRWKSRG